MFNSEDFLKLIQSGKFSPEDLSKDFTTALNEAIATKRKAEAEAEAEKKKAELKAALDAAKAKTKSREADDLASRVNAFVKTHYPKLEPKITGAELIEFIDSVNELRGVFESFPFNFRDNPPMDPIAEFLKINKLL